MVADVMWYICNPPSLVRTDTRANDSSVFGEPVLESVLRSCRVLLVGQ